MTPFEQLLYILPKNSLNLLPEAVEKAVLDKNSHIQHYFHEDFIVKPLDRVKEYTWKPCINPISQEDMNKFIKSFDWNSLDDDFKIRNKIDKVFLY